MVITGRTKVRRYRTPQPSPSIWTTSNTQTPPSEWGRK